MGLFEHFPYTNFHELNADWMLRKLKNLEQRMTAAEARLDSAEARLDAAEARLDSAEGRLDAIEAELIVINNEITLIKNRCTALEARCTALEARCTDLESRCTALEARCSELETRMTNAEARILALENKMPFYLDYDGVNIPDPLDYVEIAQSNRPFYLRWVDGARISYFPLYGVSLNQAGDVCFLYFLDYDGSLSALISGNTMNPYCSIILRTSPALGAFWQASQFQLVSPDKLLPDFDSSKAEYLLKVNNDGSAVEWAESTAPVIIDYDSANLFSPFDYLNELEAGRVIYLRHVGALGNMNHVSMMPLLYWQHDTPTAPSVEHVQMTFLDINSEFAQLVNPSLTGNAPFQIVVTQELNGSPTITASAV